METFSAFSGAGRFADILERLGLGCPRGPAGSLGVGRAGPEPTTQGSLGTSCRNAVLTSGGRRRRRTGPTSGCARGSCGSAPESREAGPGRCLRGSGQPLSAPTLDGLLAGPVVDARPRHPLLTGADDLAVDLRLDGAAQLLDVPQVLARPPVPPACPRRRRPCTLSSGELRVRTDTSKVPSPCQGQPHLSPLLGQQAAPQTPFPLVGGHRGGGEVPRRAVWCTRRCGRRGRR